MTISDKNMNYKIIDKQKKEREHRRRKRMEEHKRKVEARNSCNK